MICENCQREREQGRNYRFYYGKKGKAAGTTAHESPFWSKPYQIKGNMDVWICEECLNRERLIVSILAILIGSAGAWEMVHLGLLGGVIFRMTIFGALALVIIILAAWFVFGTREEIGERMAIHARKAELKKQGYNAFLTTFGRSRLNF
jgi:uncharacterized membrane protein